MCHGLRGRVDKVAHLAFRPPQLGKVNVSIGDALSHCVVRSTYHCSLTTESNSIFGVSPPSKPLAHSKSSVKNFDGVLPCTALELIHSSAHGYPRKIAVQRRQNKKRVVALLF